HRNVMTAIAQTAPVIRTGLEYSALSGRVNPDPHCLQNLRPSADSMPHVGQYISTSWLPSKIPSAGSTLVNSIESFKLSECNDGRYFRPMLSKIADSVLLNRAVSKMLRQLGDRDRLNLMNSGELPRLFLAEM